MGLYGNEDAYLPMLLAIEQPLKEAYLANRRMRDVEALEAVKDARRAMTGLRAGPSPLAGRIVERLSLARELNGYSVEEAVACLSHVSSSIRRHRRAGGARGYLEFIRAQVP
jgi:hypothetical protein